MQAYPLLRRNATCVGDSWVMPYIASGNVKLFFEATDTVIRSPSGMNSNPTPVHRSVKFDTLHATIDALPTMVKLATGFSAVILVSRR